MAENKSNTAIDRTIDKNDDAIQNIADFLRSYFYEGLDWELSNDEARFIASRILELL